MKRLGHNAIAKGLALLGAVALALAPLKLTASCHGSDCGCGTGTDDACACCIPDLPCTPAVCCTGMESDSLLAARCACARSIPAAPVEPQTRPGQRNDPHPAAVLIHDLPLAAEIEPAFRRLAAWDEHYSPVPARILFCVWRN